MKDIAATQVMLVSPAIQFVAAGKLYVFTFLSNAEEVLGAIRSITKR
jgi:hypothetical protein